MGRFLNRDNQRYAKFSTTKYFVDKTGMINRLLEKDDDEKFLCCSRPRRFGKSITAHMLVAYFSRGADSRSLFEPLRCVKDAVFLENLNKYDTIFMDIQAQFVQAADNDMNPGQYIRRNILGELQKEYPDLVNDSMSVSTALSVVHAATGSEFVIIFDEWDYPIRELAGNSRERLDYIEFLRMMFKNAEAQDYVRMAYLTGILPMVRAKGQSAVNNFDEYTMIDARDLGGDIGFVEAEVRELCERYGVSVDEMKRWYDGYDLGGVEVYNPLSVVRAVESGRFRQYWTETGTYEDIRSLIEHDFDGLKEAVIQMLSGNRIPVNDPLSSFLKYSKESLAAVLEGDQERVAGLVQKVHDDFISSIEYNDENSLSCTVMIALLASFAYYQRPVREFPCGKGFADLVYLPLPQCPQRPVIVVELKWNQSADTAIAQIREKRYPDSLKDYYGDIVLVGISYEKKAREHTCVIEYVER